MENQILKNDEKKCPCSYCLSTIPFNRKETERFVSYMPWNSYSEDKNLERFYYCQVDHCDQELRINEMLFHQSWEWLMRFVKVFHQATDHLGIYDTATLSSEFDLDCIMDGNFDMAYKSVNKWIDDYEKQIEDYQDKKDWAIFNSELYFKNLILEFDTYSLSDCVEEVVEGMDEDYANNWIQKRDELRSECKKYDVDFHLISCDIASEYMDGVLHFWQKDFDRWIWVQYKDGGVIGLDFQQGVDGTLDYEFESNPHLTEIYMNLHAKYDTTLKAINEAIELYYIAFILQDEVLTDDKSRTFDLSKK
jgi:hypothetical protein